MLARIKSWEKNRRHANLLLESNIAIVLCGAEVLTKPADLDLQRAHLTVGLDRDMYVSQSVSGMGTESVITTPKEKERRRERDRQREREREREREKTCSHTHTHTNQHIKLQWLSIRNTM